MELFKNTNYDFLGKKWPFIIASLVLTVAGFASIVMQGGLKFGIDFKGGTLMTVKFAQKPPLEEIRKAFARSGKIKGEVTVQSITDPATQNEVEIGTELADERQLAANRQAMEEVLSATFGQPGSGKLDLNSASKDTLAARLRDALARNSVPMAEPQLQTGSRGMLGRRLGRDSSAISTSCTGGDAPSAKDAARSMSIGPMWPGRSFLCRSGPE